MRCITDEQRPSARIYKCGKSICVADLNSGNLGHVDIFDEKLYTLMPALKIPSQLSLDAGRIRCGALRQHAVEEDVKAGIGHWHERYSLAFAAGIGGIGGERVGTMRSQVSWRVVGVSLSDEG